ncbi:MAG: isoprenylcysteine carboxylmethyltransferase family protein [Actinomycetota bacterium]
MRENRFLPFALPLSVTVIVPATLLRLFGRRSRMPAAQVPAGAVLMTAGYAMLAWTVTLFRRIGKGSLATWDPTRDLVVAGPYAHTRNPMISGVVTVLVGESVLFGSRPVLAWAAAFFAVNTAYFKLFEEPGLLERFGDDYACYRDNVPMWLPRMSPWEAPGR